MAVCYNKLWKLLIDRKMKKKDLIEQTGISRTTIAKMGRDEMERDAEVTARLASEATPSSVCPKRKYSSRKWTTCNNRAHF
jgi:hypothetical protein